MSLWESYLQCFDATEFTKLILIIEQFERVVPVEAEPPPLMRVWETMWRTNHFVRQSIPERSELPALSGLRR